MGSPAHPFDLSGRLALVTGSSLGLGYAIAARVGATPGQVALAWLLQHSPVMLPIPGTGSLDHLAENCDAALLTLDAQTVAELDALAR